MSVSLSFEFATATATSTSTRTSNVAATSTSMSSTTKYYSFSINSPFPDQLTIASDDLVDKIVADVPFFSIGVMSFAILTYFFATRNVSRTVLFLIMSGVFGFISGIFDLAAIIAEDVDSIFGLIVTREAGYALSFGFRYLFFWKHCALPPKEERSLPSSSRRRDQSPHSANWKRWGIFGILLKWFLLLGTLSITVLQMTWRFGAIFEVQRFITIFTATVLVQIGIGALFIIKYCLNIYLSTKEPRWRAARSNSAALSALLIGIGVNVGELIIVRFSESALGRLLQAAELYILFVYILITTYTYGSLERRDSGFEQQSSARKEKEKEKAKRARDTVPSFQALNIRNSFRTFRITPPMGTTPEPQENNSNDALPQSEKGRSSLSSKRPSMGKRMSSWFTQRPGVPGNLGVINGSSKREDDRKRLWDAEKGVREAEKSPISPEALESTVSFSNEGLDPWAGSSVSSARPAPSSVSKITHPPSNLKARSFKDGPVATPEPARSRKDSVVESIAASSFNVIKEYGGSRSDIGEGNSDSSLYRQFPPIPKLKDQEKPSTGTRVESPVYGLDGIVKTLTTKDDQFAEDRRANSPAASFSAAYALNNASSSRPLTPASRIGLAITTKDLGSPSTSAPMSGRPGTSNSETPSVQELRIREAELDLSVKSLQKSPSAVKSGRFGSPSPTSVAPSPSDLMPGISATLPPQPNLLSSSPPSDEGSPTRQSSQNAARRSGISSALVSASATSEFSLTEFPTPPAVLKSFMVTAVDEDDAADSGMKSKLFRNELNSVIMKPGSSSSDKGKNVVRPTLGSGPSSSFLSFGNTSEGDSKSSESQKIGASTDAKSTARNIPAIATQPLPRPPVPSINAPSTAAPSSYRPPNQPSTHQVGSSKGSLDIQDLPFELGPPPMMPAARFEQPSRIQSFPSTMRGSDFSSISPSQLEALRSPGGDFEGSDAGSEIAGYPTSREFYVDGTGFTIASPTQRLPRAVNSRPVTNISSISSVGSSYPPNPVTMPIRPPATVNRGAGPSARTRVWNPEGDEVSIQRDSTVSEDIEELQGAVVQRGNSITRAKAQIVDAASISTPTSSKPSSPNPATSLMESKPSTSLTANTSLGGGSSGLPRSPRPAVVQSSVPRGPAMTTGRVVAAAAVPRYGSSTSITGTSRSAANTSKRIGGLRDPGPSIPSSLRSLTLTSNTSKRPINQ